MLTFAKALAANNDLVAAQAFIFPSRQDGTGAIIAAEGENTFLAIKQQVTQLESQFYSGKATLSLDASSGEQHNFEISTSERLELLYNKLLQSLSDLGNLQILLFAWHQDVLYLLGNGRVSSFIYREGQLIDLNSSSISSQVISGYIQPQDEIVLCSNSLVELFDQRQQRLIDIQYLVHADDASLQDKVDHLMHSAARPRPVAVVRLSSIEVIDNETTFTRQLPVAIDNVADTISTAVTDPVPVRLIDNSQSVKIAKPLPQFKMPNIKLNRFFWKLTFWRPKRWQLILIVIIVLFLVGAVLVKYDKIPKFGTNTNQGLINQITSEISLARQQADQPEEAKKHLVIAQTSLNKLVKQAPQETQINNLRDNFNSAQADITKLYTVNDWPIYLSVSLVKSGFTVDRLSVSVGQLLLLDRNQKSLIAVNVEDKTNTILAGPRQMGEAFLSSINGDYAYSYSVDKGVVQIDTANQQDSQVIKPDDTWGQIQDLVAFASNVYLLDNARNQIWKYVPIDSGFSERIAYFIEDQTLSDVKMMEIDSSVWLLRENNSIDRYTGGVEDFFSTSGLETPIQDIPSFFVSDKTEYIYILDPNNNRVVVLAKNGEYHSIYSGDKFKDAQDLIVDEVNKTMYVLIQNVIYQVPMH